MLLKDLFNTNNITDEKKQFEIAYLLASFGCLYENKEQEEEIDPRDLNCYEIQELYLSEYDYECGAYHNGIWFSMKSVIHTLVEFEEDYEF